MKFDDHFDKFGNYIPVPKTIPTKWRQKDGTFVRIVDLSDQHLLNIVSMLMSRGNRGPIFQAMIEEQKRRKSFVLKNEKQNDNIFVMKRPEVAIKQRMDDLKRSKGEK